MASASDGAAPPPIMRACLAARAVSLFWTAMVCFPSVKRYTPVVRSSWSSMWIWKPRMHFSSAGVSTMVNTGTSESAALSRAPCSVVRCYAFGALARDVQSVGRLATFVTCERWRRQ